MLAIWNVLSPSAGTDAKEEKEYSNIYVEGPSFINGENKTNK
jgi:hypothetical protein